jgi:hypothetical protein
MIKKFFAMPQRGGKGQTEKNEKCLRAHNKLKIEIVVPYLESIAGHFHFFYQCRGRKKADLIFFLGEKKTFFVVIILLILFFFPFFNYSLAHLFYFTLNIFLPFLLTQF